MRLSIDNREIRGEIPIILEKIKKDTKRPLFKSIRENGDNVITNCPIHKGGQENKPSCNIFSSYNSSTVQWGTVHCFTCGYTAPLYKMVADCFFASEDFGKRWLLENYAGESHDIGLAPPISIGDSVDFGRSKIDLSTFNYYHPYMWDRKLSREVVDKFSVGFNRHRNTITFPVWDAKGNLVTVTERSVNSKKFYIETGIEKPVYLLNFIIKEQHNAVYVCESQINALTLWSWGYPSVALFGTGTKSQYALLNRCGVRKFILCLDGDEAGDHGIERFKKNINADILVFVKRMPRDGRDVNDLTKEEFDKLEIL